MTNTSLHDFRITDAAHVLPCGNAGAFRAVRRWDQLPVVLHRFRPAGQLLAHEPMVQDVHPPDFRRPFVTRFVDIIEAAGSAYLVEPLPVVAVLEAVWRAVLLHTPREAVAVLKALARQLTSLGTGPSCNPQTIVMTPQGVYGLLARTIATRSGHLPVRASPPEVPFRHNGGGLGPVLDALLLIEDRMSQARGQRLLPEEDRVGVERWARHEGRSRTCTCCKGASQ